MGWVDGIREVIKLGEPQPVGGLANPGRPLYPLCLPGRKKDPTSSSITASSTDLVQQGARSLLTLEKLVSIKDSHSASKKTR